MEQENIGKISDEILVKGGQYHSLPEITQKLSGLNQQTSTTTEIISNIFSSAVDLGVSDIHFEPGRDGNVIIRFRVDGVLSEIHKMPLDDYRYVVSRIKLLSGIKFNLEGAAGDGRFTIKADDGRDIEVRVAIAPSEYGDAIITRLLDPKGIMVEIPDLGFRIDDYKTVQSNLMKPQGAILVTGPTGSGKTTTLYAFLQGIRTPEIKIITIEDPIEYHLDGIQQTQVNEAAGYTFDNGLRSILRQDPDMILVGEIRDFPTAETAMHASLTGHLVFSTLHTNSASGAIPRLIDMGIKPQIIGSAVTLLIAQRLVRKICPYCKQEVAVTEEMKEKISKFINRMPEKISKEEYKEIKLYQPTGCDKCHGGFKGRLGIFEIIELDKEYEKIIRESPSEYDVEEFARSKGFVSFQEDGILKALNGITTLDEVERITGPLNW